MIILGIETSCDETALSIIDVTENEQGTQIKILANAVLSQIAIHTQYGGVFPMVAKREHGKNLTPLLKKVLEESGFSDSGETNSKLDSLATVLDREPELLKQLLDFLPTAKKPAIDLIAVTYGPGLEPALWVGVNFAKALSVAWDIPVVATNHMEGHILISLQQRNQDVQANSYQLKALSLPALALLISGGHTELVLVRDWLNYEIVGRTRDDAIGEAFDKVARILGLPYPGGPQISALAEKARSQQLTADSFSLPRPMLKSDNLDFSFSGLKTAVLYLTQKLPQPLSEDNKMAIAREFEDAATEVVIEKVRKAIDLYGIETLILGGGVVANKNIRSSFQKLTIEKNVTLHLPEISHSTDNALMIAIAGYFNRTKSVTETTGLLDIKANGNLSFPSTPTV
ncbi:MAG: tRNA (adenosine(37)-N6)-threonylcarbamoyltransferase complex transferase subunit TsaD [Patescibacteria group bacterium]